MNEDVFSDRPRTLAYPEPLRSTGGPRSWLAIVRRRFLWLAVLFPIGVLLTLAVTFLWPATYRASATILIEQQEIPPELVRSTVTAYADERLQIITQRVMTTPTLLELMERYDLYPMERAREPREKLLERIRNDIGLEVISAEVTDPRSGRAVQATIAFELSFRNGSAQTAFEVSDRLLTLYQRENRRVRTESVDNTAQFLAEEAEKLRTKIETAEARLAAFKSGNVTDLPELFSVNVELMHRTERELADVTRQLRSVSDRERYLQAALGSSLATADVGAETLTQLDLLRADLVRATATYGANHPDVRRLTRQVEALELATAAPVTPGAEGRLALEAELAELRTRYSAQHPDVLAAERELQALASTPSVAGPDALAALPLSTSPAIASLQGQLEATRTERRGLEQQYKDLTQQLQSYQNRLLQTPAVESEYRTLSRDYENDLFKYREIRNKLLEAQLAQSLESGQRAERFTVLEYPAPPQQPVTPNRASLLFLGLVLSLGVAVVAMSVAESTDRTVRGPQEMAAALGLSPLAMVPVIRPVEQRQARARLWLAGAGAGVLLLMLIGLLVHTQWLPLDTAVLLIGRRFGLS